MVFSSFSYNNLNLQELRRRYRTYIFSESFNRILQDGVNCYQDIYLLDLPYKYTEINQALLDLKRTAQAPSQQNLSSIKAAIKDLKTKIEANNQFLTRKLQSEKLQSATLWQNFQEAASTPLQKAQLAELESHYQTCGKFFFYSADTLLTACNILEKLTHYFNYAKNQMRHENKRWFGHIPKKIVDAYLAYADEQLGIIYQEQQQICQAMMVKLKLAAQDPCLQQEDALDSTIDNLKQTGVLNVGYKVALQNRKGLTAETFSQFHQIIQKHGSYETKRELLRLPWLHKTASNSSVLFIPSIQQLLAQEFNVVDFMPAKLKKPSWLFKGNQLRYQWFNNFYPYAKIINHLSHVQQKIAANQSPDSLEKLITEFHMLNKILIGERTACQAQKNRFNHFWQKTSRQFLHRIDSYFQKQQTATIELQLGLLEKVSLAIANNTFADDAFYSEKSNSKFILDYIQKLDVLLESMRASNPNASRSLAQLSKRLAKIDTQIYKNIQKKFDDHQSAQEISERLSLQRQLLLPFLNSQIPADNDHIENLIHYYHDLKDSTDACNQSFIERVTKEVMPIVMAQFSRNVSALMNVAENISYAELINNILNQAKLILSITTPTESVIVNQALNQLAHDYFSQWSNASLANTSLIKLNKYADTIEPLLLTLAGMLNNNALQHIVAKSSELRAHKQFNELRSLCRLQIEDAQIPLLEQQFEEYVISEDKLLFDNLAKLLNQKPLSPLMEHIKRIKDRMLIQGISDVRQLTNLTPAERSFFGLNQRFFDRMLNSSRQPILLILQATTKLSLGLKELKNYVTFAEKQHFIAALKQQIRDSLAPLSFTHPATHQQKSLASTTPQRHI